MRGADFLIWEPNEYGPFYYIWMALIGIFNGVALLGATVMTFWGVVQYWKGCFEKTQKDPKSDTDDS